MGEVSWHVLRQIVYERADGCCEYCQTCETNSGQTMQIDHINPLGDDVLANLCLSCWNCNSSKHKATLVTDPETGARVPLFNPRTQV
jgi:5-methylcytosine-specific restriction endonuclease McrA